MKILLILPGMGPGGAERVAANLANQLVREENYAEIIYFTQDQPFYSLSPRVGLYKADSQLDRRSRFAFYCSMLRNSGRCVKLIRDRIGIVHPGAVISFGVEADILTFLAVGKRRNHLKWISSEITDPNRRNPAVRFFLRHFYPHTDYFICQNQTQYDFFDTVPNRMILPNAVRLTDFPDPVDESAELTVISVGRLVKEKNYALLIRSFAKAAAMCTKPSKLFIYGEGPERSALEDLITKTGNSSIFLPGTDQNIFMRIRDASIFVLSSDFEGYSNALIEAVLLGLPVISTDHRTGDARELFEKGCCLLVKPGDESELTDALVRLMNDDSMRLEMRRHNSTMREDPMFRDTAKQWEEMIKTVISRK